VKARRDPINFKDGEAGCQCASPGLGVVHRVELRIGDVVLQI
jgi:hypothetical protein